MILFYLIALLLISVILLITLEFDFHRADSEDQQNSHNLNSDSGVLTMKNDDLSILKTKMDYEDPTNGIFGFSEGVVFDQNDFNSRILSLKKELKQNLKTLSYIHHLESRFMYQTSAKELEDIFKLRSELRAKTLKITQKIRRLQSVQMPYDDEPTAA